MTEPVIILTPDQLRALVRDAVREGMETRAVNDSASDILTTGQVAELCGVTVQAINQAVSRGRIRPDFPARTGGPRVHRFRRSTVERYLSGGEP